MCLAAFVFQWTSEWASLLQAIELKKGAILIEVYASSTYQLAPCGQIRVRDIVNWTAAVGTQRGFAATAVGCGIVRKTLLSVSTNSAPLTHHNF